MTPAGELPCCQEVSTATVRARGPSGTGSEADQAGWTLVPRESTVPLVPFNNAQLSQAEMMTYDEFSRVAQEAFQSIPVVYREGVDGVTTVEAVETHPELPDVVTLGECLTQGHISDWLSPETTRSRVVLYYGSFRKMAGDDPDFDWEEELWETLTHELQHHLESLADEDALEAMDYAMDESFKRERDEPFDPWYFQWGEPQGEGAYQVEEEIYIERVLTSAEFDGLDSIDFTWQGQVYRIPRPEDLGDIHFVIVDGIEPCIQVVLIQRASWRQRLRGALHSEAPVMLESGANARRITSSDP